METNKIRIEVRKAHRGGKEVDVPYILVPKESMKGSLSYFTKNIGFGKIYIEHEHLFKNHMEPLIDKIVDEVSENGVVPIPQDKLKDLTTTLLKEKDAIQEVLSIYTLFGEHAFDFNVINNNANLKSKLEEAMQRYQHELRAAEGADAVAEQEAEKKEEENKLHQ
jgi:hypothetical protein